MSPRFRPSPHDSLPLFGEKYFVQPHLQQPAMAYAAEGKAALVYKVRKRSGPVFALKVFKKQFRDHELLKTAERLRFLQSYEGLRAAQRQVVESGEQITNQYPELLYAMLMPWITGTTWNDLLITAGRTQTAYGVDTGIRLCDRFLTVMQGLESNGIAHTDIAPGNVVITTRPVDVQLLDLEDVFIPGLPPPAVLPKATPGYDHPAARGMTTWASEGDRYSAAVMAAEMLLLPYPELAATANDSGLFGGNRTTPQGKARFSDAYPCLDAISPTFAQTFKKFWDATAIKDCPRLSELHAALTATTPQSAPAVRPSPPQSTRPVIWVPRQGSVFATARATTAPAQSVSTGVTWTGTASPTMATTPVATATSSPAPPDPSAPVVAPWVVAVLLVVFLLSLILAFAN